MKNLIKLLDSTLECSDIVLGHKTIMFHAHLRINHAVCAYCELPSTRVHVNYIHQFLD